MTSLGVYSQAGSYGGKQNVVTSAEADKTSGIDSLDSRRGQTTSFLPPRWSPTDPTDATSIILEQEYLEVVNEYVMPYMQRMRVDTREGSYVLQGTNYFTGSNHRWSTSAFTEDPNFQSTSNGGYHSNNGHYGALGNNSSATLIGPFEAGADNARQIGWFHDITFNDPHVFDSITFETNGREFIICTEYPDVPNKFGVIGRYAVPNSTIPASIDPISVSLRNDRDFIAPSKRWRIIISKMMYVPGTPVGGVDICIIKKIKFFLNETDSADYNRSSSVQGMVKANALFGRDSVLYRITEVNHGINSFSFVYPIRSRTHPFDLLLCHTYGYHKRTLIDGTYLVNVMQTGCLAPTAVGVIADGSVLIAAGRETVSATFMLHMYDEGTKYHLHDLNMRNLTIVQQQTFDAGTGVTTLASITFMIENTYPECTIRMSGLLIK